MDCGVYKFEEAAEYCSVSIPTLRALVNRGDGPDAFKIGRRWMFPKNSLDRWLEELAVNRVELEGVRK